MSLLGGLAEAIESADDTERARRLSEAVAGVVPHRALALLVDGCARRPLVAVGEEELARRVTGCDFADVDRLMGHEPTWQGEHDLGGEAQPMLVVAGPAGGAAALLLVLESSAPVAGDALTTLREAWNLFALASLHALEDAGPAAVLASRAAAGERARVAGELADAHGAALSSVLGTLRASHLDDRAARREATELASSALIDLRATSDTERERGDEALADAFARLRAELTPLARFSDARLELVTPIGDAALAAPVAQTARAITRSTVLSLLEQPEVERLRVAWTAERVLEIAVRDDGPGELAESPLAGALTERALALGGAVEMESVPGWGTQVSAQLPLEDVTGADADSEDPLATLRPRELEVLAELARGARNRDIAERLQISENTVKYHVANVLAKLEVDSRGQAALIARDAGLGADAAPRPA